MSQFIIPAVLIVLAVLFVSYLMTRSPQSGIDTTYTANDHYALVCGAADTITSQPGGMDELNMLIINWWDPQMLRNCIVVYSTLTSYGLLPLRDDTKRIIATRVGMSYQ